MTDKEIGNTLRTLIDKNYVVKHGEDPYRLTKLGKRARKGDSNERGSRTASKKSGIVYVTTARIDTTRRASA